MIQRRDGYTLITLEGDPYELGLQHGVSLREQIWSLWSACDRWILRARGPRFGWGLERLLRGLAGVMERYVPNAVRLELRGVSHGSGLPYGRLLILNCFDDLMNNLRFVDALGSRFACSAFAAVGAAANDGHAIAGRNLDYYFRGALLAAGAEPTRVLREHVVAYRYRPATGLPFVSVGWPGIIGVVTAQNAAGLALACLTSPAWCERPWGMPLPMLYRLVAQGCSSIGQVQDVLTRTRRTIGNNLLVVSGPERDARVFELNSRRVAARSLEEGTIAATNHYQVPALARDQVGLPTASSAPRLARVEELLARQPLDSRAAQAILGDEMCLDEANCEWARLRNAGTIYSTVFEPSHGRIWVRASDTLGRRFEVIAVPDTSSEMAPWPAQTSERAAG
jgi:hypothetical protein